MPSFKPNLPLRSCLVIFITCLSFSIVYPQTPQELKEIDEAILNAQSGNYQQAIPVLEEYIGRNDFDDLKILEINVYLNLSYLATGNNSFNLNNVNLQTDTYITKYGISKSDTIKLFKETELLHSAAIINTNVNNHEKVVYYLLLIKNHYEENNLLYQQSFQEILGLLAQAYYNLSDFSSAIKIGLEAFDINNEFYGEPNINSLKILEILYVSYQSNNEPQKALECLQKKSEIGKVLFGENNPDHIESLKDLATAYLEIGNYKKALEFHLKEVELSKEVFGEKHPKHLTSLINLTLCYSELNDIKEALEINLHLLDLQKKVLGEKHPDYLACLDHLASLYSIQGDYQSALRNSLKVVELGKEVLGEKHPDFLANLFGLGYHYSNIGDYQMAIQVHLRVIELGKEVLGEKHQIYLANLINLIVCYSKLHEYKKALEINLHLLNLQKEVLGDKHPDYLTNLNSLANVYLGLGDLQNALEIFIKVIELRKEVLGEKHPDYLTSLANAALCYSELGNYIQAFEFNLKVVELRKDILGEKDSSYLTSLSNLAHNYTTLGNYTKALELNLKIIELRKEVLGEKHPSYLTSLANLGTVYVYMGDYLKALEINLNVVEISKEIWGEKHPDFFTCLGNLAYVYSILGNYNQALEIQLKVVESIKQVLGDGHPKYLLSLNNLATTYLKLGEYNKALEIEKEIVDLTEEDFGVRHPDYLIRYGNLASIYLALENYNKALEINQIVTDLTKEVMGASHPDYLRALNNLAENHRQLGQINKALKINQNLVGLSKKILGDQHPDYLTRLNNLAVTEFDLSQTSSALNHYLEMLNKKEQRVLDYLSIMTSHQREYFWNQNINYFIRFNKYLEKEIILYPEGAGYAYKNALFTKGLLLNTAIDFEKLIAESGIPEAIAKFEELKLLKLQIQRLQERPLAEQYLNVDSLENIAQKKESELVKLSKEYGDYTRNLKITWKDVQANLSDNDVAIEFVEYPTLTDTVKYAALVLRKGWQYPKMIPLFCKNEIEEYIQQDVDKIYSYGYVGKQIKKYLWEPLEEFIFPGERVYFSPAGIIYQLAIENLAWNDSTILGERYQMYRLSSTKELVVQQPESKSHTAVVYGGLDFNLDTVDMIAGSKKFKTPDNLFTMLRGYSNDYSERSGWNPIHGTGIEAEQITRLLSDKNYQVKLYTGKEGMEESFKALSGKKNGIIHIATHGFFLPIEESRQNPFVLQRIGDDQPAKAIIDPMLRSGLIMAGGNKAWLGEDIPDNIEDGVLTAKEISHMDLRGTDMVVLSACETGLGEVSSEGVFGLQRSFKQAGVKTIVMSLWKVNDEATKYMMTEFYASMLSGKEKREAFLEAKQKCREKYIDPRYWAAFIMLN